MTALLINETVIAEVKAAIERARAAPIPWEWLRDMAIDDRAKPTGTLTLAERPPKFERPRSQFVLIPFEYRASISFEQQPAGLCRHLSVSVREGEGGVFPSIPAMTVIAKLFGFTEFPPAPDKGRFWVEEFEPGRHAVNVIETETPAT